MGTTHRKVVKGVQIYWSDGAFYVQSQGINNFERLIIKLWLITMLQCQETIHIHIFKRT